MRDHLLRTLPWIGLLAAVAAALNLHAPTVFFDSQIMLGGSLGVFALLQFGWPGLAVGVVALAATAVRWGHPFELLIGTGFLVWLTMFLDHFNGGWANRDNGRVVPAAAVFWLVVGLPLEVLVFTRTFDLPAWQALGIGLKESVTGLLNTTLGLLAFLAVRWRTSAGRPGQFSIRGLTFAAILSAISIPALGLVLVLSHQIKTAVLERQFLELRLYGDRAADLADLGANDALKALAHEGGDKQFLLRRADGSTVSSDPALFERLRKNYVIEVPSRTGRGDLGIYRPLHNAPVIATDADSYWFATYDRPVGGSVGRVASVTIVKTPPNIVRLLDYHLLLPSFSILLAVLLLGTVVAGWAGRGVDHQFRRVLPPSDDPQQSIAGLFPSGIRELHTLIEAIKDRTQRIELAASAAGLGFWSRDLASSLEQWDDRMLAIYGVRREDFKGHWEPFVHSDDLPRVQELTDQALHQGRAGRYEYRIIRPDGTLRHVRGMSTAICDARGEPVREIGVNFDITDEQESAAREKQLEAQHRRELETKLKTSLHAAAIAHEINQPLSRVLLRARMGLETATGAERDRLAALVADAERVVTVIQKMKVLLRNVETVQQEVDLATVTASAMHQVKRVLRDAGVSVSRRGPDSGCILLGDAVQLQMIVTNLLTNAIEAIASRDGGRREIVIEHGVHDGIVELVVGDSGPGWPGGTLDEMLLNTTKPEGSGVGLYVVKTAVDNHRGEITIGRSPLGEAEFRISFPRAAGGADRVRSVDRGRAAPIDHELVGTPAHAAVEARS